MGAGAAKRLSAVRWGVAGNIVVAWVLTLPASAAIGAAVYGISPVLRLRRGRTAGGRRGIAFSGIVLARRLKQGRAITAAEG